MSLSVVEDRFFDCLKEMGYSGFTDFQKRSFHTILRGFNAILVAPTGSGKTEAAVIPVMLDIRLNKLEPIVAIYVTPLRALNRDIAERLSRIAKCFEISVNLWHGDTPYDVRREIALNPPHILVTTPESFTYIILNKAIRKRLRNLKYIIIDELHELMSSKRGFLLFLMIHFLESLILKRRVRKIALTATLSDDYRARVVLSSSHTPLNTVVLRDESVKNYRIDVIVAREKIDEKLGFEEIVGDRALAYRLKVILDSLVSNRAVLIFTNTRPLAEKLCFLLKRVAEKLGLKNVDVDVHHGSLSQRHRLMVEERFKRNELKGLIATSSMELGIDIGYVDYVIQYGSPKQAFRLLQRIGRSGHRIKSVSRGAVLVRDNILQVLEAIVLTRRALSNDLEEEGFYENPLDVLGYAIVAFSHAVPDGLDPYELYANVVENPLFSSLDYETFSELLSYLTEAHLVKIQEGRIVGTKRGHIYVHKVNMIPETVDYSVIDIASNTKIGVLDEEYVVLNLEEGDDIVLAGELWRIVSIDEKERKVYVEKPRLIGNEVRIPHWEGETIPVDYKVAREVGSLIHRLKSNNMLKEYGDYIDTIGLVKDRVQVLCDNYSISIAYYRSWNVFIVALNGGDRVNRFVKDVLRIVLNHKYPSLKLKFYSSPYAVFIVPGRSVSEIQLKNIMDSIGKTLFELNNLISSEEFVKNVIYNSKHYLWRIYQVAQRFGAIDPEKGGVSRKVLEAFIGTIIGKEAFREVLYRDYDIEAVKEFFKRVESGVVRINRFIREEIDDFYREYVGYIEIPQLKDTSITTIDLFREKLMRRKVTIICLSCGWSIVTQLGDLVSNFDFKCKACGKRTLTLSKSLKGEEVEIIRKANSGLKLSREEEGVLEDLKNISNVLSKLGSLGLIILGARGVGVRDVESIIKRLHYGEDLYEILYEYEKRVIRYKRYFH